MSLSIFGRVVRNSIAVSGALLIQRAASMVLYIFIARYLGVFAFGQFSLVYTFYIIFQVPAKFGLINLIVREVAKDKSKFGKYLINGHLVVLVASLFSLGIWALLAHLLGYSPEVIKAGYLLGIALIPHAMSTVCQAIFKAFERMQFIVYSFAVVTLIKIALVWLFLWRGFGLNWIIGLLVMSEGLMLLMGWYFIYRHFPRLSLAIDLNFCRPMVKAASTFLGIGICAVIFLRLNIVVLSKLQGELEVALYNAVFLLIYFFMVISMSLEEAIYPLFSVTYKAGLDKLRQYAQRSSEVLISLAFPLAVGFFFLADSILLVYKEEFVAAAPLMKLMGWMLIPLSFNRILAGVLKASNLQRSVLTITLVNMVSLFILSVVLIYSFGLMGAGAALLTSVIISFALHYRLVFTKLFPLSILRVTWKPIVSSLVLAGFLFLMREGRGLLMTIPSAVILYGAVLLSLNFLFGGLLRPVRVLRLGSESKPGIRKTET